MSRILDVYFHEIFAGKLRQEPSGILSFQYDKGYISLKAAPTISVSLPVREEHYDGNSVKAFFSGLLPDDILRGRLARYLGLSEKNPFGLLEAIGGECAGAISFYPEGKTPPKIKSSDIEILDDHKLQKILELLKSRPLMAGADELRLSLAGAQDKLPVGLIDGKIAIIKGTTPTSHILKPPLDRIKDSVHNELFCMRLARLLMIAVPNTEIYWIGDTPCFLVERYDRIKEINGTIKRLHQEDFCQALGIMPELKYEREGGPGIQKGMDLLKNFSLQPVTDQRSFLHRIIFNYLIGNADAHGKNFSFLYKKNMPELSPAYDLLCTAIYPELSKKMAMRIGKEYDPDKVFFRHWCQLVPLTASAKKTLEKDLLEISTLCLEKAQELKNSLEKEGIKSPVFNDICNVINKRSKQIQEIYSR